MGSVVSHWHQDQKRKLNIVPRCKGVFPPPFGTFPLGLSQAGACSSSAAAGGEGRAGFVTRVKQQGSVLLTEKPVFNVTARVYV